MFPPSSTGQSAIHPFSASWVLADRTQPAMHTVTIEFAIGDCIFASFIDRAARAGAAAISRGSGKCLGFAVDEHLRQTGDAVGITNSARKGSTEANQVSGEVLIMRSLPSEPKGYLQ